MPADGFESIPVQDGNDGLSQFHANPACQIKGTFKIALVRIIDISTESPPGQIGRGSYENIDKPTKII
jgi:hypothetical protein